ncbi:MAG: right-handed parallel beta-helix repeat-containing protein [bacterium]
MGEYKFVKRTLTILICLLGLISNTFANTHYVSTTGADTGNGTFAAPWATPGYGSKEMLGGDTLIIRGGQYTLSTYWDDMITPPSGTINNWTVIKGDSGVILQGRNNLSSAIEITDKSYIVIENLEITNLGGQNFREGVNCYGLIAHCVLRNLYIHHLDEFGMDIQDASDLNITNCTISYCGFGSIGGPTGVQGGWRNVVVESCTLSYSGHYYQGGPGPSPYDRPDGFGIEPSSGPIEIANTVSMHNRGDGLDSKVESTYIHNCIVANNSCDGLKLWGTGTRVENVLVYGRGDGNATQTPWTSLVIADMPDSGARFELVNVTIHDVNVDGSYPSYMGYEQTVPMEIMLRNVIIEGNGSPVFVGEHINLIMDHSLIYISGNSEQLEVGGTSYDSTDMETGVLGSGNLCRAPLFKSPAWGSDGNYHLQVGSPAINSGTSLDVPAFDLEYFGRPYGSAYDMGCYEYHPVSVEENAKIKNQISKLKILKNPFFSSTSIRYSVPEYTNTRLTIHDLTGRTIKTIVNGKKEAGNYTVGLDGKELSAGIYFVRFVVGDYKETHKLILVK